MTPSNSSSLPDGGGRPNPIRQPAVLDGIDRQIVAELVRDGRLPNNTLAERVGVAPSTCLARTRGLIDRGVIRGFRAEVDHARMGADLQALVSVRIRPNSRADLPELARRLGREPGVQSVYFITGAFDFLIHVVAADTEGLRRFVADSLSRRAEVESTQTSLVFDHIVGEPT